MGIDDSGLSKCISTLANKKWKGHLVTVQQARESFMERLARERKESTVRESTEEVKSKVQSNVGRNVEKAWSGSKKVFSDSPNEEREIFKGFGVKSTSSDRYDPLQLFKAKLAGEDVPKPNSDINTSNMGTVENGLVMFEDDETEKSNLLAISKHYHSSSEDEDKRVKEKVKLKKKSCSKTDVTRSQSTKMADKVLVFNSKNNGKFYEDSSDDDTEVATNKTGTDVLKTFQSFSNFWQDSDNELDQDEEQETKSDITSHKKNYETIESDAGSKKINFDTREVLPLVSDISMTRYDPTQGDHEQYLRSKDDGNEEVLRSSELNKATFKVNTDLKKAFGDNSSKGSTFSFGFGGSSTQISESNQDNESETIDNERTVESFGRSIEHSSSEPSKSEDNASKFGLMLRGKGISKTGHSFFFNEEDSRLQDGVSFFFDCEIDTDKLREEFNEKRPVLADILRKRARNKAKKSGGMKSNNAKRKSFDWRKGGKRRKLSR